MEKLESIGRSLDEAKRQIRDGQVDPELLKDLDMTPEEFRQFVEEYANRVDRLRRQLDRRPGVDRIGAIEIGSDERQAGRGASGAGDIAGTEELTADELRDLYESRMQNVSPEYRKQVEEYYRNIMRQDADQDAAPEDE